MGFFDATLALATLLCSLVAGFLFAFAVVAMPGIGTLPDGAFIRAFQVMDRVIQDNQPLFISVWVGSVVALLAAAVMGFGRLEGVERSLLLAATVLYLVGVQVPTARANIPLNNQVQAVNVETASTSDLAAARAAFEPRWNRWNEIRTVLAGVSAALLILLALLI
jgi:uncharacterized membrane protein